MPFFSQLMYIKKEYCPNKEKSIKAIFVSYFSIIFLKKNKGTPGFIINSLRFPLKIQLKKYNICVF